MAHPKKKNTSRSAKSKKRAQQKLVSVRSRTKKKIIRTLKKSSRAKSGALARKVSVARRKKLSRNRKTAVSKKGRLSVFRKHPDNPIISPRREHDWEAWQVFNPAAVLFGGKVHFLYRAIGPDGLSRFGYASSSDGFSIDERSPFPVYEHRINKTSPFTFWSFASGGSFGGCEDPRMVRIDGEDELKVTYTACDGGLRVALTSINGRSLLGKRWNWKSPRLISPPGEVHKNWVIFPEKIHGKYAVLHSISPSILIEYCDNLDFKEGEFIKSRYGASLLPRSSWESSIRGAGAPPIKTKQGWILFYHAMDKRDPGKYKVGAMLLDLKDPTKILHRTKEPLLEPDEDYENNGFKSGVVYVSGAVVKDGELLVYYGGADSCVCVAHARLSSFLKALLTDTKPKLARGRVGRKI